MGVAGVIAEYNPFHNGHVRHIAATRRLCGASNIIAVMSGNYVQRGEPALLSKYARTKAALENGISIVIELPYAFAAQSAEIFARGAIQVLNGTGIVESICFGAETDDISFFLEIADILCNEPLEYKLFLKNFLSLGESFAKARYLAISEFKKLGKTELNTILNRPNNILAIEYLAALKKSNSRIKPFLTKREGAGYHEMEFVGGTASATSIRNKVFEGLMQNERSLINSGLEAVMPQNSLDILRLEIANKRAPNKIDNYSSILHYILLSEKFNRLMKNDTIYSGTLNRENESLLNRILNMSQNAFKISEVTHEIKTKRFAYTKIQRTLMNIIMNFSPEVSGYFSPLYLRILGFRRDSEKLLSRLSSSTTLPLITSLKQAKNLLEPAALAMFDIDLYADELYSLGMHSEYNIKPKFSSGLIIV